MRHKLDIETWARKAHFEFFSTFEEPFYGVCVHIDCTEAYRFAKEHGFSVYLYFLHRSLLAAQQVEAFRYRMEGKEVYVYDRIDAASTIGRSDDTFGYGYFTFSENVETFLDGANKEADRVRAARDLVRAQASNLILYSALPWIDFTSLSHARMFSFSDSRPRISFGKMTESEGRRSMPVSIHVHHALIDGLHVGQYVDRFQELMKQP